MRGIFAGGGGRGGGFLILHCPVGGGWGGAGRSVPVGLVVFCSLSRGVTSARAGGIWCLDDDVEHDVIPE